MRLFLGGLVGLFVALVIAGVTATILGIPAVLPGSGPLVGLILALILPLSPAEWLLIAFFTVALFTVFAYVLATIGLLPVIASTPISAAPTPLPVSPLEETMRGFMIGLTAGLNFGIWALLPFGLPIAIVLGLVCFAAVFTLISRNLFYQGILGWLSWLMPMSYFVTPLGILFFLINLPFALGAFGFAALRFDARTSTIETTGGLSGITGFRGGFNLGNFTFLATAPGVVPATVQTAFGAPGLSAHETGHTLTIAAFGGLYHWTGAVDENVPPFRRLVLAYSELVPESHFPRSGLPHVRVWS
ncbi:hypothetical protein ASG92_25040 [Arthrobacter sp. Soil736]|uniref:hypothetical protein n=1 Tax=Arthrobacter sp. Soil736 TaxID=1736395 RepID=UPI0006FD7041|nr:hypothetical protein [Arthrobacter sp. Soil736]KRE52938.1 hypothetical protein ASG92_25040 [Arthrobacter sp. Soil736]